MVFYLFFCGFKVPKCVPPLHFDCVIYTQKILLWAADGSCIQLWGQQHYPPLRQLGVLAGRRLRTPAQVRQAFSHIPPASRPPMARWPPFLYSLGCPLRKLGSPYILAELAAWKVGWPHELVASLFILFYTNFICDQCTKESVNVLQHEGIWRHWTLNLCVCSLPNCLLTNLSLVQKNPITSSEVDIFREVVLHFPKLFIVVL